MTKRLLPPLLTLLLAACDETVRDATLPPLPEVNLAAFEPAVRQQLEDALAAARARPAVGDVNRHLGMLLHAYGWLPQAVVCYRRALRGDPADSRARYYLARILMEQGVARAARETLAVGPGGERRGTDDVPTLILLGQLSLDEADLSAAERWFERAYELAPRSPRALVGIGQVRRAKGNASGAVEAYRKALDIAPDFGEAAYGLALLLRAQGDLEGAKRYLERHAGAGGDPVDDPHLEALERLRVDAESVYRRAGARLKEGRTDEAITLYEQALKLNPEFVAARYNIALAYLRAERPQKASPHLEAFLEQRPKHVDAHNNLGLCFLESGRIDAAKRCFATALEIQPSYYKAHFNLALALLREGPPDPDRRSAAKRQFLAALDCLPEHAESHYNLALLLLEEGDGAEARAHLLAALDTEPRHEAAHAALRELIGPRPGSADAYRGAAALLREKRRFAAAVDALRQGVRATKDWRTGVALAWILATCPEESLRRPDESIRLMESICEKVGPSDPRALDTLAAGYAAAGDFRRARNTATTALAFARRQDSEPMRRLALRIAARLRLYERNRAFYEE